VRRRVLELDDLLGRQGPGCVYVGDHKLAILWRLATDPAMRTVWRRFERRAKSETALAEILDCAWQNACLTPPIQTPNDRLTLVRLWHQEMESLRLTNPELAQYCVPISVYFDQVKRDLGVSNSPLLVNKHRRQYDDDRARAFVRLVGARIRELLGGEFLGSLVMIVQVALRLTIEKRQAQHWLAD
jgi:hypothetical protein